LDGTPVNAAIVDDVGVGTISDDGDVIGRVSITNAPAALEGTAQPGAATFTLNLADPSPQPVSVQLQTGNGIALAGSDFQATTTTLTFPAGQTQLSATIPFVADGIQEAPNEDFQVTITP